MHFPKFRENKVTINDWSEGFNVHKSSLIRLVNDVIHGYFRDFPSILVLSQSCDACANFTKEIFVNFCRGVIDFFFSFQVVFELSKRQPNTQKHFPIDQVILHHPDLFISKSCSNAPRFSAALPNFRALVQETECFAFYGGCLPTKFEGDTERGWK